jgi:ribosomal protein L29
MKAEEITKEDIKGFSLQQLREAEHDTRRERAMMRMSVLKQQKSPLKQMRQMKKNIARIKTYATQLMVEQAAAGK